MFRVKYRFLIFPVLVVVLTAAVYLNSLGNSFVFDDRFLIVDNSLIRDWSQVGRIFTTTVFEPGADVVTNFYRPLQILSYLIDFSFWELNPFGYHLSNILWHLLSAILLFGIIQLTVKDARIAFLTAGFFAVHPVHTEAVSYVSGRADPQGAAFLFLSLLLFLRSIKLPVTKNETSTGTVLLYGASLISFLLALFTKETALMFPLAVILVDRSFFVFSSTGGGRRIISRYLAFFLVAAAYLMWRKATIEYVPPADLVAQVPVALRLFTSTKVFMLYLGILLLPLGLHMERSVGLALSFFEPAVILSMVGLVIIGIVTVKIFRLSRPVFFGIAWFFLHLLPFANLYPLNASMAEHWLYLPSVGYFLILATVLVKAGEMKKIPVATRKICLIFLPVALFVFYGGVTIRQNAIYWKNEYAFCRETLRFNPGSVRLHNNLGLFYFSRGMLDKAIAEYRAALEIDPRCINARLNLGRLYADIGRLDDAINEYRQILNVAPGHVPAHYNLALAYHNQGLLAEAEAAYRKVLEKDPGCLPAYYNLGVIFAARGEPAEAEAYWRKALEVDPQFQPAREGLSRLRRE